jgi:hypothetical protein
MFVTKRIVLAFINNTTPITSHLVGRFFASRTSVVFVQATRRVEREEEFFANYGDSFRFPHGCQCHLCAATAAV